jgi:hypothetical protein
MSVFDRIMNNKSFFITAVLVLSFAPAAFGQPWAGSGDANDPYQIWTAEDMQAIGADANYWDAYFKLMADIDLGAYTGTSFNIIGMYVGFLDPNNRAFTGVFDGDGHTISNFTYDSNGVDCVGLFRYTDDYDPISSAVIRDLGLINPQVNATNGDFIGSIVGIAEGCEIQRCWSKGGTVSGKRDVGGFVGFSGRIVNCYCENSVSGGGDVGGFAGGYGYIENCYSTGSVIAEYYAGGLAGTSAGCGARIINSFWDVNTSGCLYSQGGTGLTTAQMQTIVTYVDAGWDFTMLWTIDEGNDYPRLCWEGCGCINYSGGSGTEEEPYLISTGQQMYLIGSDSNDWDKHFKLMADIDMSEYTGTMYNIIGNDDYPFEGVFDGNGHTISNFTYNSSGINGIGLFGWIDDPNAEIKNLGLIEPDVNIGDDGSGAGALVGVLVHGSVSGFYVEGGNVTGKNYVGGLVGRNWGDISNSYSSSGVTGDSYVGGLVGYNHYGEISNSYSAGEVTGGNLVGGLVGSRSNCIFTSCFWDSDVNPDVNGIGDGTTDPNVVGLPTVLMQTESTFTNAGWDFVGETVNGPNDIWDICEGTNYPKLAWSIPAGDFMCPDGVNMLDFAILGEAWMSEAGDLNWDPGCDISEPADEVIDWLDLGVFVGNWLMGID